MIHSKKLSVRTVWTVCCLHGLRFNMTVSAWTKTTWSTLNIENPTKTRPSGLSEKTPKFSTKDVLQLEMISAPF